MSTYVVTRDGQYYAGFVDGHPVWQPRRARDAQFCGEVAEKIVQQLTALGYAGCELKMYRARLRSPFPQRRGGRRNRDDDA